MKKTAKSGGALTLQKGFSAVGSPHRLELITALGDIGPASIAELARRLGRSPHSLYYHVKLLEEAGIVVPAATRRRGRRDEQVWSLAAGKILLEASRGGVGFEPGRSKAIDSMLRLTARELQSAVEKGRARTGFSCREIIGLRMKGRVDEPTLRRINRHIDQIEALIRKSNPREDRGRVFALTIVLSPAGTEGNES